MTQDPVLPLEPLLPAHSLHCALQSHDWPRIGGPPLDCVCLSEEAVRLGAGLEWILEKRGPLAGRCQIVGRMTELGSNPGHKPHLPPPGAPFSGTKWLCGCLPADGETLQGRHRSSLPSHQPHHYLPYFFTSHPLSLLSIRFPSPAKICYADHQEEVSVNDKGEVN